MRIAPGKWNDTLQRAEANGGIVLFGSAGHSIFAATHVGLYEYLPIDRNTAIHTHMLGANAILIYRNQQVIEIESIARLSGAVTINSGFRVAPVHAGAGMRIRCSMR